MNREIYRALQLPVFQNRMFKSAADAMACARGDVVLVQDARTGLISNSAFQPELMQYDADYQNEQAVSAVFRSHLAEITRLVERHFLGRSLIEVGCGKAYFLEHLLERGFDVIGMDPAYEGDNPRVRTSPFNRAAGLRADGLILRHVLEHIPQPMAFLDELCQANGGQGTILIEVPCLDWIARRRAWFDIFYEHVNYFRLEDFQRMFGRILDAGHVFGGQYLYVVADLATLREPAAGGGLCFAVRFHRFAGPTRTAHLRPASQPAQQPPLANLGRGIQGGDFRPQHATRRGAHRLRYRHQPCQTGPLPASHRFAGICARFIAGQCANGHRHLRDEQQLPGRNP